MKPYWLVCLSRGHFGDPVKSWLCMLHIYSGKLYLFRWYFPLQYFLPNAWLMCKFSDSVPANKLALDIHHYHLYRGLLSCAWCFSCKAKTLPLNFLYNTVIWRTAQISNQQWSHEHQNWLHQCLLSDSVKINTLSIPYSLNVWRAKIPLLSQGFLMLW